MVPFTVIQKVVEVFLCKDKFEMLNMWEKKRYMVYRSIFAKKLLRNIRIRLLKGSGISLVRQQWFSNSSSQLPAICRVIDRFLLNSQSMQLVFLGLVKVLIIRTACRTSCYNHFSFLLVKFGIMLLKLDKAQYEILFAET